MIEFYDFAAPGNNLRFVILDLISRLPAEISIQK